MYIGLFGAIIDSMLVVIGNSIIVNIISIISKKLFLFLLFLYNFINPISIIINVSMLM